MGKYVDELKRANHALTEKNDALTAENRRLSALVRYMRLELQTAEQRAEASRCKNNFACQRLGVYLTPMAAVIAGAIGEGRS